MEELHSEMILADICELEDFGFTDNPCERQIENPENDADTLVSCLPIPGLENEYSEFWVNFTTNEFYGIPKDKNYPVLIPRSQWMKPKVV